jgi:hypothetical protein
VEVRLVPIDEVVVLTGLESVGFFPIMVIARAGTVEEVAQAPYDIKSRSTVKCSFVSRLQIRTVSGW